MTSLKRQLGAATAGLCLTLALSACSGEEQSVADACAAISTQVADANQQMITAITEVNAGTKNPKDVFGPISQKLEQVASEVKNSSVKQPVSDLATAFTEFAELYNDFDYEAVKNGDTEATEAYKKISKESVTKLDALATSGNAVESVCNTK